MTNHLHPDINDQIKLKIRMIRQMQKISQEEMAARLFVSRKTYHNIELGHTRIDVPRLEQIARVLDLELSICFRPKSGSYAGPIEALLAQKLPGPEGAWSKENLWRQKILKRIEELNRLLLEME